MNLNLIKESIETKVYHIPLGKNVPMHEHADQDEVFYCIKGSGFGVLEDGEVELNVGDTILEMVHLTTNSTNQGFHFCLESDNFDEDYTRLINAGIPVDTEPHTIEAREAKEEGWRRVVFVGPDGELIEFRR